MAKNEDNHSLDVFSLFVQTERKDSKTFRWPQKVMKTKDRKGRYTGSLNMIQCKRCACKTKYIKGETPKLKDFICARCFYTWGFYVEEQVWIKESPEFLMALLGEQQ
jgi:hypothetical protein